MPKTPIGSKSSRPHPTPQRASRRLLNLPPESGPLPVKMTTKATGTNTTDTTATPIVLQPPREPPKFHGSPWEDAQEWLEKFERVATLNNWDDDSKLRHVYFSLEDSAKVWFENREASLSTWHLFKQHVLQSFPSENGKERAELLLQTRMQQPGESVLMYVEEMHRLFRRADPAMTEERKLRFLMRGVKENLFAGLLRNTPSTVEDFLKEAGHIEKSLQMRARHYDRFSTTSMGTTATPSNPSHDDSLRDMIRAVIREEMRVMFPTSTPEVSSLASIIREEVQHALGTHEPCQVTNAPEVMTYASAARRVVSPPTLRRDAIMPERRLPSTRVETRAPPSARTALRKTDIWRAPDRRPLCYHCGEAGHVYRRCPYREMGLRGFPPTAPPPRRGERPRDIANYLTAAEWRPRYASRSPSPARYQSPERRSQFSSARGRSPSPGN